MFFRIFTSATVLLVLCGSIQVVAFPKLQSQYLEFRDERRAIAYYKSLLLSTNLLGKSPVQVEQYIIENEYASETGKPSPYVAAALGGCIGGTIVIVGLVIIMHSIAEGDDCWQ